MRLVTYVGPDGAQPGVLVQDAICDLSSAVRKAAVEDVEPASVRTLLSTADTNALRRIDDAAQTLVSEGTDGIVSFNDVALLPPVPDPQKILCLALNSRVHCLEAGIPEPSVPWYFPKWHTSLLGHNGVIVPPPQSQQVDWEGEVAIVIGRPARGIEAREALRYVAGVMPFNDVSGRDFLVDLAAIQLSKAIDTFAPCGPALVTLDEIDDINALPFQTFVNGDLKQDGNTNDLIHGVAETVGFHSRNLTLMPGDIIAMGTTLGVGLFLEPPQFLGEGDVVEVSVGNAGTLRNVVGAPSLDLVPGPTPGAAAQKGAA